MKKIENPILPFNGNVYTKIKQHENDFYAQTYKSWCFNEKPTHLISLYFWSIGLQNENVFVVLDENIYDENEAIHLAKECVNKKEYGRVFMYKSTGMNSIWGACSHFPRFDSEKTGFVNIHNIIDFKKIESSDLIYFC